MKRNKQADERAIAILIRGIDPELHAAISAAAEKDERSVQVFLLRFLREHFVKGNRE